MVDHQSLYFAPQELCEKEGYDVVGFDTCITVEYRCDDCGKHGSAEAQLDFT